MRFPRAVVSVVGLACCVQTAQAADVQRYQELDQKPFHEFTHGELDEFLRLRTTLHNRKLPEEVAYFALRTVGSPADVKARTDDLATVSCVTVVNRSIAMAAARNWEEYYLLITLLQFKDGDFHPVSRNHFTETQWVPNNAWLLQDLTADLGQASTYTLNVPVTKWLAALKAWNYIAEIPPGTPDKEDHEIAFTPKAAVEGILDQLRSGDIALRVVKVTSPVRLKTSWICCNHMSVLARVDGEVCSVDTGKRKTALTRLKHHLMDPYLQGFIFLRLRPDAEQAIRTRLAAKATTELPRSTPLRMDSLKQGAARESEWFNIPAENFKGYNEKRQIAAY